MSPLLENSGKCKLINSDSRSVVAKEWRKKAMIIKGYFCSGTKENFYWCFIVHYLDYTDGFMAVYMCLNLSNVYFKYVPDYTLVKLFKIFKGKN